MSKEKFSLTMTKEERHKKLLAMEDDEIDCSDSPELDEEFFKTAKLVEREPKTRSITIRIDSDVLEALKAEALKQDKGYQTLMNDVLRTYAFRHQQKIQTVDDRGQSPQQNDQRGSTTL